MFSTPYNYKTRQADEDKIRHEQKLKLDLAADGFRWRAAGQFNQLPLNIRNLASYPKFKIAAKNWIRQNVKASLAPVYHTLSYPKGGGLVQEKY